MYINSIREAAITGVQMTNAATAMWTVGTGGRLFVKSITLVNTTAGNVPDTCQITDGDPGGAKYKLVREADACIVPYIDDADYKLKHIDILFTEPYLVENGAFYGLTGGANGCKATVFMVSG